MNLDPLASGYTPISPYAYTANSPVRFIDPNGMEIGDGIELFNRFKKDVSNRKSYFEKSIANRTKSFNKRIAKAKAKGNDDKSSESSRKIEIKK